MIHVDTIVSRSPDPLTTEVEGEVVMMDVESGLFYSLNKIGTSIWHHLAEPIEVGDLCAKLEMDYIGAPDVIRQDVLALLDEMHQRGLIRLGASS